MGESNIHVTVDVTKLWPQYA